MIKLNREQKYFLWIWYSLLWFMTIMAMFQIINEGMHPAWMVVTGITLAIGILIPFYDMRNEE